MLKRTLLLLFSMLALLVPLDVSAQNWTISKVNGVQDGDAYSEVTSIVLVDADCNNLIAYGRKGYKQGTNYLPTGDGGKLKLINGTKIVDCTITSEFKQTPLGWNITFSPAINVNGTYSLLIEKGFQEIQLAPIPSENVTLKGIFTIGGTSEPPADPVEVAFAYSVQVGNAWKYDTENLENLESASGIRLKPSFSNGAAIEWNAELYKDIVVTMGGKVVEGFTPTPTNGGAGAVLKYLDLTWAEPLTAPGEYSITIPEGLFILNGAPCKEVVRENLFSIAEPVVLPEPFKVAEAINPQDGATVTSLGGIEISFPEMGDYRIGMGTSDKNKITLTKAGGATVYANRVGLLPGNTGVKVWFDPAIEENGQYTLTIEAGAITCTKDGSDISNPEPITFTFTVEVPEPTPVLPTLDELILGMTTTPAIDASLNEIPAGEYNIEFPALKNFDFKTRIFLKPDIEESDIPSYIKVYRDGNEILTNSIVLNYGKTDDALGFNLDEALTEPGVYTMEIPGNAFVFAFYRDNKYQGRVDVETPVLIFKYTVKDNTPVVEPTEWKLNAVYNGDKEVSAVDAAAVTKVNISIVGASTVGEISKKYIFANRQPKLDLTKLVLKNGEEIVSGINFEVKYNFNGYTDDAPVSFDVIFTPAVSVAGTYALELGEGFLTLAKNYQPAGPAGAGEISPVFSIAAAKEPVDVNFGYSVLVDGKWKLDIDGLDNLESVSAIRLKPDFTGSDIAWNEDLYKNIVVKNGETVVEIQNVATDNGNSTLPKYLDLTFAEPLTTVGSYSISIPEGLFILNGAPCNAVNKDGLFSIAAPVVNPFTTPTISPADGSTVENFTTLTLSFELPEGERIANVNKEKFYLESENGKFVSTGAGAYKSNGLWKIDVHFVYDENEIAEGNYALHVEEGAFSLESDPSIVNPAYEFSYTLKTPIQHPEVAELVKGYTLTPALGEDMNEIAAGTYTIKFPNIGNYYIVPKAQEGEEAAATAPAAQMTISRGETVVATVDVNAVMGESFEDFYKSLEFALEEKITAPGAYTLTLTPGSCGIYYAEDLQAGFNLVGDVTEDITFNCSVVDNTPAPTEWKLNAVYNGDKEVSAVDAAAVTKVNISIVGASTVGEISKKYIFANRQPKLDLTKLVLKNGEEIVSGINFEVKYNFNGYTDDAPVSFDVIFTPAVSVAGTYALELGEGFLTLAKNYQPVGPAGAGEISPVFSIAAAKEPVAVNFSYSVKTDGQWIIDNGYEVIETLSAIRINPEWATGDNIAWNEDLYKDIVLKNGETVVDGYSVNIDNGGSTIERYLVIDFDTPLETAGVYTLSIPEGLFILNGAPCEAVVKENLFTIVENPFRKVTVDPEAGSTVGTDFKVTLSYALSENQVIYTFDGAVKMDKVYLLPEGNTNVEDKIACRGGVDKNNVEVYFENVPVGNYTLVVEAGAFTLGEKVYNEAGELIDFAITPIVNPAQNFNYTVVVLPTPFNGATTEPAEGAEVNSLSTIVLNLPEIGEYHVAEEGINFNSFKLLSGSEIETTTVTATEVTLNEEKTALNITFAETKVAGPYTLEIAEGAFHEAGNAQIVNPRYVFHYTIVAPVIEKVDWKLDEVYNDEEVIAPADAKDLTSVSKVRFSDAACETAAQYAEKYSNGNYNLYVHPEFLTLYNNGEKVEGVAIAASYYRENLWSTESPACFELTFTPAVTTEGNYTLEIADGFVTPKADDVSVAGTLELFSIAAPKVAVEVPFNFSAKDEAGEIFDNLVDLKNAQSLLIKPELTSEYALDLAKAEEIVVNNPEGETVSYTITEENNESHRWIRLNFNEVQTIPGNYIISIPEGLLTYGNNYSKGYTNVAFSVLDTNPFKNPNVDPANGSVVGTDFEVTLSFELPEGEIIAQNDAEGNNLVNAEKFYLMGSTVVACKSAAAYVATEDGVKINKVVVRFAEVPVGNYTLCVEKGAFALESNADVVNPAYNFNYEVVVLPTPFNGATTEPAEGAEVKSLSTIVLNLPEIGEYRVAEGINNSSIKLLSGKWGETEAYPESVTLNEEKTALTITFAETKVAGPYTLEIAEGAFHEAGNAQIVNPRYQFHYTIVAPVVENVKWQVNAVYDGDQSFAPDAEDIKSVSMIAIADSECTTVQEYADKYANSYSTPTMRPAYLTLKRNGEAVEDVGISTKFHRVLPGLAGASPAYIEVIFTPAITLDGNYALEIGEEFMTPKADNVSVAGTLELFSIAAPMPVVDVTFAFTATDEGNKTYFDYDETTSGLSKLPSIKTLLVKPTNITNNKFDMEVAEQIVITGPEGAEYTSADFTLSTKKSGSNMWLLITFNEVIKTSGNYSIELPEGLTSANDEISRNVTVNDVFVIVNTSVAVRNILGDCEDFTVVDMNGRVLFKNVDADAISNLENGMYIINGKKVLIRK